jgi:hypothetical protein
MANREPTSIILTRAHRDAIFEEIGFAFDAARDLPLMLEHGAYNIYDRREARDVIWRLEVAARLLDQLGWERDGNREGYVLEVDEDVDRFVARIESYALAALADNRRGLLEGNEEIRARVRRLIDTDLDALEAARVVRTAFRITPDQKHPESPPLDE